MHPSTTSMQSNWPARQSAPEETPRMSPRRIGKSELRDQLAVYFVADPEQTSGNILDIVDAALAGGVTTLQLRAKRMGGKEMYDLARAMSMRCRETGTLFVVNDRVDVAMAVAADGV